MFLRTKSPTIPCHYQLVSFTIAFITQATC